MLVAEVLSLGLHIPLIHLQRRVIATLIAVAHREVVACRIRTGMDRPQFFLVDFEVLVPQLFRLGQPPLPPVDSAEDVGEMANLEIVRPAKAASRLEGVQRQLLRLVYTVDLSQQPGQVRFGVQRAEVLGPEHPPARLEHRPALGLALVPHPSIHVQTRQAS